MSYSFVYKSRKPSFLKRFIGKVVKISLTVLFLLLFVFGTYFFLNQKTTLKTITSLGKKIASQPAEKKAPEPRKPDEEKKKALLAKLKKDLAPSSDFRVSINDIEINDKFGIKETSPLHAASVIKVLVATTALRGVEQGKLSLDQPLGGYTLQYQIQQMINQSNNLSWDLINNLIGKDTEQRQADSLGLLKVDVENNRMTTRAVSDLLYGLYAGKVLSKTHRQLLLSYMANTNKEDRIPPGIPKGIKVYHKWGAYNAEIHDAAIVAHPRHPFTLVVFTNGGGTYQNRVKAIQKAAADVYAYFDAIEG
ncbi:MAG: serine hydrolase [bacterium]|nr:serine hydrolase [bacterium]